MKTRYFILATLALAGLAVSCKKSEVGGETPSSEDDTPVAIQLSTNIKVNKVSATKAGVDKWAGQQLYIYALPTNEIPTAGSDSILVKNAPAAAPNENPDTNPNAKKDITLYKDAGAGTFYYYPADKSTFDFYGYYVDNAFIDPSLTENIPDKPEPTIDAKKNIKLHFYLDGSQDIMLAKADKDEDVLAPGVTELISPANAYSAYSARKGVKPNLVFQHQLSRFVFYVVAGNGEGSKVKITGVTLTSNNQADLVIANLTGDRGIANPSGEGTFNLKDNEGNVVQTWFPKHTVTEGDEYTFVDDDRVGESIMVIPDSANGHKMVMTMQQMNGTGEEAAELDVPFTYEYNLVPGMVDNGTGTKPEVFLPGYQYNVKIVVYGRQQVDISVTLTPWGNGGTITIDNDKEWGDEPKLGLKATNGEGAEYYLYFYAKPIVAASGDTPGTEVKFWNKNANEMAAPESGTYMFEASIDNGGQTLYGVTLTKAEGENAKTTVTALVTENPTPGGDETGGEETGGDTPPGE